MTTKYEWVPGMREISGFGGEYEDACRRMLQAGLAWLDAHPDAKPQFRGEPGVREDNAEAKALSEAIGASVPDCSGAMHGTTLNSCMFIRNKGWDEFVAQMSKGT